MSWELELIKFIIVFIAGFWTAIKWWRPGLNTDKCTSYLKKKGYTVHLRVDDKRY